MNQNKKLLYSAVAIFAFFCLYFFVIYYPSVSDIFDYWHMAVSIRADNSGFIDLNYPNPGYYILTIIIAKITNLSYNIIPLLPFQAIPLILLTLIILYSMFKKDAIQYSIIIAVFIIIISKFGNKGLFLYWSHGIGFVLSLLILVSIIVRYRSNNKQATSLVMIVSLICLNFVSYKLCFFNIILLLSLEIIELIYSRSLSIENNKKVNFRTILIIFIVAVFSFNTTLYNSLLPSVLFLNDRTSSGTYKLSLLFQQNPFDAANEFYFRYQTGVRNALTIWLMLLLLCLLINTVYLLRKIYKLEKLDSSEKILLGFTISSVAIFVMYSIIGMSDFSYVVFSAYLSFVILYRNKSDSTRFKHFIVGILVILILLNSYLTIVQTNDNHYSGIRDDSYYEYLNIPSHWYVNNIINKNILGSSKTSTDVFTGSYFAMEIARRNISNSMNPQILSKDETLFLLGTDDVPSALNSDVFIINWKLKQFSGNYWEVYKSWSNYKHRVKNNPGVNIVYCSGDVSIATLVA